MEDNIDSRPYIPEVANDCKPKVGMEFASLDEAFLFYNQYARQAGFSARLSNSKKDKRTNEVVWKQFVCFKEGRTDEARSEKQNIQSSSNKLERARGAVRTGCKAKVSVVKQQTGPSWVVSNFTECHNHILSTPSKVHLLRSHRNVSTAKKALTQQFFEANVPTCQQMRLLEIDYRGPEFVGCTERDIRNFGKELREEQKGIDAATMIEFFTSEKEKNSAFFFDYETDSDNKLIRCFWVDPFSRMAYNAFGDVVVFDTTYNTNKYAMIFAPLVGVNHHHQTIIFGCAFLSDEKTESFVWLFRRWMEAMPKGPPKVIITDQDPAMTKAIAQVFPETVHRYCLWHILNKFPDKIDPITFRAHYHAIKKVIVESSSPDEFEKSWNEVLQGTNLEGNEWLSMMYNIRDKWVPAYVNHIFCAGMSSSQRSESSHSFFKRYVSNKNSLMDFITRFNRALRHQRHNELQADHVDMNEQPKIRTHWPMENQMVKLYTKKEWLEFQKEMSLSHGYYVQPPFEETNSIVYNVQNVECSSSSKHRRLIQDKITKDCVSCSCKKFEFEGIPCRHMLAFFRINQVSKLPDKYILKRWTRNAKVGVISELGGGGSNSYDANVALMSRHSSLSCQASMLIDDASLTNEGTNFLKEQFKFAHQKIKEMHIGINYSPENGRRKSMDQSLTICDPQQVRAKGCGKRMKSSKEKSTSKARLCSGCGRRGVSHDKRNCPNLQDRSTTEEPRNSDDDIDDDNSAYMPDCNNMFSPAAQFGE